MKRIFAITVIMCFSLIIVPVAANDLANSTITSSKAWVIAGGFDNSTILVTAIDMNGTHISGVPVTFSLDPTTNPDSTTMGTFVSSTTILTDTNGQASVLFKAKKKSGNATIVASMTYNSVVTTISYIQKIDHDLPFQYVITSPELASVGTETYFNVSYYDQWLNPVDNRNPADTHMLALQIGSVANNAKFDNYGIYQSTLNPTLDLGGNLSVKVLLDYVAGQNNIHIGQFSTIPDAYPAIFGIANGVPAYMSETVTPIPPIQPADNQAGHTVSIIYKLFDKYNNPSYGRNISILTTAGESFNNLTSNEFGQIFFTYGPRSTAGNITITATATENASVLQSQDVSFYSTAPVNMILDADPQTVASIDANSLANVTIAAEVMDIEGNPVSGVPVSFSLGSPTYDSYLDNVTALPYLVSTSATTNDNGQAIVHMIPGGFSSDQNVIDYNPSATGSVPVTATWNGTQQTLLISWKNYPYLTVRTSVNPTTVAVNDTVTVTIRMTGDGWKLQGKPNDVVILTDLAGGIGGGQLLTQTRAADTAFVSNASSNMYIGLASFGNAPSAYSTNASKRFAAQVNVPSANLSFNPYGSYWDYCLVNPNLWATSQRPDTILVPGTPHHTGNWNSQTGYSYFNSYPDATIDHVLTSNANKASLISTISNYQSRGGTNYAAGINAALLLFARSPTPNHNRTIIIMGDGIPMVAPISPGSLESYWPSDWYPRSGLGYEDESDTAIAAAVDSANRAKSQNIQIYAAAFPLNSQIDQNTLKSLTSSLANYYYVPDTAKLTQVLLTIQGQIQPNTSVNTLMDLNFQNVSINNITWTGSPALRYFGHNPESSSITGTDGNTTWVNQTNDWNTNNQHLHFVIGNISLGQTWQASFELNVTQPGNICMFGNGSSITFNNGEGTQTIPRVCINSVNNLTNMVNTTPTIILTPLVVTKGGTISDYIPFNWNTTYPGTQTAVERAFYTTSYQDPQTCGLSPWIQFDQQSGVPPGDSSEYSTLDVRGKSSGTYYICVLAQATDALSAKTMTQTGVQVGNGARAYIKLE